MKRTSTKTMFLLLFLCAFIAGNTTGCGKNYSNDSSSDTGQTGMTIQEKIEKAGEAGKEKLNQMKEKMGNTTKITGRTYHTIIRVYSRNSVTSVLFSEPGITEVHIDGKKMNLKYNDIDQLTYDVSDLKTECDLTEGKHTIEVWSDTTDDKKSAEFEIDREDLTDQDTGITYGLLPNHPAYFEFEYALKTFGKRITLKDVSRFHGYDIDEVDDEYVDPEDEDTEEYDSENAVTQSDDDWSDDDYVLPQSDSKKLKKSDLKGLSKEELRIARNEIYARHGRRFLDEELQAYFDSKDWYEGYIEPEDFVDSEELSSLERRNAKFIKKYE